MTATADDLVTHMSMISDAMLVRDIKIFIGPTVDGPVLTETDRELVQRYYELRRKSPDFKRSSEEGGCPPNCDGDPHRLSCQAKSHRAIAGDWARIMQEHRAKINTRSCLACGKPLGGRQRQACSTRCQKRIQRGQTAGQSLIKLSDSVHQGNRSSRSISEVESGQADDH